MTRAPEPGKSPPKTERNERNERRAAALRANLQRRKVQERGRERGRNKPPGGEDEGD